MAKRQINLVSWNNACERDDLFGRRNGSAFSLPNVALCCYWACESLGLMGAWTVVPQAIGFALQDKGLGHNICLCTDMNSGYMWVFDETSPLLEINTLNVSLVRHNVMVGIVDTFLPTLVRYDVSPSLECWSAFLNCFKEISTVSSDELSYDPQCSNGVKKVPSGSFYLFSCQLSKESISASFIILF